jgi:hypothetical protein
LQIGGSASRAGLRSKVGCLLVASIGMMIAFGIFAAIVSSIMTRLPSVILVSGIALCLPHSVAGGGNQGGGDGAEIQGRVTHTSTWTGGQFRETKVVTVTGTWHASSNPWFKVTCGGGTLGLKSPLTFGGLAGTISADITWSDSATRTPPSTKEEIEAARQDIVRRHITVTLPFRSRWPRPCSGSIHKAAARFPPTVP